LLLGIADLDLALSFAHPIEEELRRGAANATWFRADLNVKRTRRGKTEGVGHGRDGPDQEPTTFFESDRPQCASALPARIGESSNHPAVLNDFDGCNRITRVERRLDLQIDLCARFRLENLTGQLAAGSATKQRPVGNKDPTGFKTVPPLLVAESPIQVNIHAVVAHRIREHARGAPC